MGLIDSLSGESVPPKPEIEYDPERPNSRGMVQEPSPEVFLDYWRAFCANHDTPELKCIFVRVGNLTILVAPDISMGLMGRIKHRDVLLTALNEQPGGDLSRLVSAAAADPRGELIEGTGVVDAGSLLVRVSGGKLVGVEVSSADSLYGNADPEGREITVARFQEYMGGIPVHGSPMEAQD